MTAAPAVIGICECGGSRTQHSLEDTCWCPACLAVSEELRCVGFRPRLPAQAAELPPVDRHVARTGAGHGATSHAAGETAQYRSGTLRRMMYELLQHRGRTGHTDDEMERHFQRSHQTISSARNTLLADGHIADGGQRRTTRTGHEATVWVLASLTSSPGPEQNALVEAVAQDALFGDPEPEGQAAEAEVPPAIRRVARMLAKKYGGVWSAHVSQAMDITRALRNMDTSQLAGIGGGG